MAKPVSDPEWGSRARADLLAILEYVADENPAAARRLLDEIRAKAETLRSYPKRFRAGRVKGTREMVLGSYLVIYAESSTGVKILRVLHGAQQWPPDQD